MVCYLRKWLYATAFLVLLCFLKIPMCGQSTDPLVGTPQTAQPQPQPQPSVQNDQSSSKQPQAQDSGGKHSDKTHFRLGSVTVGAGYAHFPNSFYAGGFWPYSFYPYRFYPLAFGYDPFYYGYPLFYAPYVPDLVYGSGKGEVKLAAEPKIASKTASVYLNGAYAGTARNLKSMWLEPGAYDLSLSAPGQQEFHQRIYVLSGKSLKIAAKLSPTAGQKPEKSPEKSEERQ